MKKYIYFLLFTLGTISVQASERSGRYDFKEISKQQLQIALNTSNTTKLKSLYNKNPKLFIARDNFDNLPTVRSYQLTPLMYATFEKHNGAIPTLLTFAEVKETINAQDNNGSTALMMAVETGNMPAAKYLLKAGANPEIGNPRVGTPLKKAYEMKNNAMVALLEKHSAK